MKDTVSFENFATFLKWCFIINGQPFKIEKDGVKKIEQSTKDTHPKNI